MWTQGPPFSVVSSSLGAPRRALDGVRTKDDTFIFIQFFGGIARSRSDFRRFQVDLDAIAVGIFCAEG